MSRCQDLLDVGLEDGLRRGRPLHRPIAPPIPNKSDILAKRAWCSEHAVGGYAPLGPLALGRSGVAARHGGVRTALVDKHEPTGDQSSLTSSRQSRL